MIRITDNLGNITDVDVKDFLPLTSKEIVFKIIGDCLLSINKGFRYRISFNSIILIRRIPISRKIILNSGFYQSIKHHKLQYLQLEHKVEYVFIGEKVNELETNIKIVEGANILLKKSMIVSRKLKTNLLESEINNLLK